MKIPCIARAGSNENWRYSKGMFDVISARVGMKWATVNDPIDLYRSRPIRERVALTLYHK
jgi:hypothetical protein